MNEFKVEGVEQEYIKPSIVSSNIVESSGVLLNIVFETNPLNKVCMFDNL